MINGASASADRATRPSDQAPAGLGDTASIPCAADPCPACGALPVDQIADPLRFINVRCDRAAAHAGLAAVREMLVVLEDDGKEAAYDRAEELRARYQGWLSDIPLPRASAIEAQRAATAETGAVHESAVGNAETPKPSRHQSEEKGE